MDRFQLIWVRSQSSTLLSSDELFLLKDQGQMILNGSNDFSLGLFIKY